MKNHLSYDPEESVEEKMARELKANVDREFGRKPSSIEITLGTDSSDVLIGKGTNKINDINNIQSI